MKSYCVIEFNDKDEKKQVLTLLMDTEVDFKVTTDLKKFVAEKFRVTIVENVVVSPNDIDPVDIKRENIGTAVDIAPPAVDTIQNEKHSTQSFSNDYHKCMNTIVAQPPVETKFQTGDRFADVPPTINALQEGQDSTLSLSIHDPIVVDRPIPDIDTTQKLMNIDDYGTFVPYLDRMVEPKTENIDNTAAVGANENNQDVTNENQVDIPSTSMKRRSCRSAKRPRYLIDEDSDEECTPLTKSFKKSNQTMEKVAGRKRERTTCRKCGKEGNAWYSAKIDHVAKHTDIMKFECSVNGCEIKCKLRGNIVKHMKLKHPNRLDAFTNIELTSEQNAEIDTMMRECFDDSDGNSDDKCQLCHQNIGGKTSNSFLFKKEHALNHVNFMLYKCMEDRCSFGSKTMSRIMSHTHQVHFKNATPEVSRIQLSKEQELEIEEMLMKCFPNLDKDVNAA